LNFTFSKLLLQSKDRKKTLKHLFIASPPPNYSSLPLLTTPTPLLPSPPHPSTSFISNIYIPFLPSLLFSSLREPP
jgi:hypothetical protein